MRGRRPAGPNYVERLSGSPLAKERLRIILQTMAGELRLQDACDRLGVSPQRFHQLREEALSAALAGLEPGLPGRPARVPTPQDEQMRQLEAQLAAKDLEARTARAREEIALTLPRAASPLLPAPEKKTRRQRSPRRRRRPPGTKSTT
jgi:hypothetical protein